jgi:hypothetical protein
MDDRFSISIPKEGFHTLVAEYSFLHFDKAVNLAKTLLKKGVAKQSLHRHLREEFKNLDKESIRKAVQLALGFTPRDDFQESDIQERVEIKSTSIEILLQNLDERFKEGTIVFFEKRRWVITSIDSQRLRLKYF